MGIPAVLDLRAEMKITTRRRLRRAWRWLRHPLGLVGYGVIGVVTVAMMVAVARSADLLNNEARDITVTTIGGWQGPMSFVILDTSGKPILTIRLDERRIEVPPDVDADEAARAVIRALEAYLPAPCKEDHQR